MSFKRVAGWLGIAVGVEMMIAGFSMIFSGVTVEKVHKEIEEVEINE